MASDALSQNEIDALLNAGKSASRASVATRQPDHVVYDFRRPHRISKDRLRTIEAMYERLAKSLEAWLMSRLRRQIELRLQSVEQYSFGEFTLSLSTPCAAFGFDIKNFEGQKGVIDIGHELAFLTVDRFFGGTAPSVSMNRALTPIERLTVRTLIERTLGLLKEVWQDHAPLDLEMTTFESFPEMVQGGSREDPVLVANIEIAADNLRSLLIICLPLGVLEKFFAEGDGRRVKPMVGSASERAETRRIAELSLRGVSVDVAARLPVFDITMRELLRVGEGGILPTGLPTDTPLEFFVGGRARFNASPGRIGQRVAVQLGDQIEPGRPTSSLSSSPIAFTPDQ
ncbi:MAG: FliM/FliN family flagellar motor switch protein [Gemmatimonadaceae bacterium]|nr:FliM/FliN family flagellar motor switch protein [Gemmatimonadaceae bacterium]